MSGEKNNCMPFKISPIKARGGSIRIPTLMKIFFALKYSWYIHSLEIKSKNYQKYHFGLRLQNDHRKYFLAILDHFLRL